MSLIGWPFLTLVVAVTVAAFVVAVVLWPAMSRRSAGNIAARIGTLTLVSGLVLITAATQLNAQFLFFADWSDLQGALNGTVTKTALSGGARAAEAAKGSASGAAAPLGPLVRSLPPGGRQDGDVITYSVKGPLSGIVGTVVVKLPPGYLDPGSATTRYPVLETFQGYPSTPRQWIQTMHLGDVMAQQVDAKRMRSALIVSPQVEVPPGVDTECVNGGQGSPQLETWLARDVPDWVARSFRVPADRSSWATIGLSTGGWCAAMVAMLHPAQYGAAIVMGGYFRPEFSPLYEPYAPGSALAARYNLVTLAVHHPPPVALWVETSHSDPVSYSSTRALLKAARAPIAVDAVVLQHAGHRIGLWKGLLPQSLSWLGTNLSGFRQTA
ncbi:enterochelin esterase-like enzyme [Phycicoccus badiiscoriae]|uniref:Enterochelin esterase-like enzyme n=1 Tax=Pedococcus badiiscoriae TaxID=642776 RepID=A0A852WK59_9MICO|nr:alpha/beta hydrolase-fold protein [Pedococcus badiiscoriae]NYG05876.1 enterochelin esterase-like enzyme [Pedococcus badiiscoriae]